MIDPKDWRPREEFGAFQGLLILDLDNFEEGWVLRLKNITAIKEWEISKGEMNELFGLSEPSEVIFVREISVDISKENEGG